MSEEHPAVILEETVIHATPRYVLKRVRERLPHGVVVERDVVDHPGAAVVLPVLEDGRLVLIDQYRPAVQGTLLELPAGTLDWGEDPLVAAKRELEEETGYRACRWEPLLRFYPAPGITSECMHAFLARDLRAGPARPEPGECLETRIFSDAEVRDLVARREIRDGKTLVVLQHYWTFLLEGGTPEVG